MFKIEIQTDNAAFAVEPEFEIGRILALFAERIGRGDVYDGQPVMDYNGNRVGKITWEDE